LVLDTESEHVLRRLAELIRDYDTYLIALRHWHDLTESTKAAMAAGMAVPLSPVRRRRLTRSRNAAKP